MADSTAASVSAVIDEDAPMTVQTRNRSVLFTFLVACGALSFGFSIGLTGPLSALQSSTTSCLPSEFLGDKNLFSLFVSLLNLGAMFGAVSGGVIADKLGRRGAFLVACSISMIGSSCIVFGYALWILNSGRCVSSPSPHTRIPNTFFRFINGFGMGLFSLLVPMYISEIAPTSLRGSLGTCNQLGISVGLVIAFAIGIPTADDLDKREWWRYVAAISSSPVIVLFLGFLLYVPETPRWLLGQGRDADALNALKRLRGSDAVAGAELKQLQRAQSDSARQSGSNGPTGLGTQLKVMFNRKYLRPLSIAIGLQVVQQFTGINGVFFYLGSLFSGGKVDAVCDRDDIRQAILYSTMGAALQVPANLICVYLTNKTGRRVLLASSLVGMCVCLAVGGCASFFGWPFAFSATAVCCYIFFFAIGCGPVPWLMMSEVMPARIRGPAMSLGTLSNWLGFVNLFLKPAHFDPNFSCVVSLTHCCSAYIVVQITPFLADIGNTSTLKGPFAEFWIFAAVCAFYFPTHKPAFFFLKSFTQVCARNSLGHRRRS
jgi:MFS transporter, SP family, ERD6-like sugar transporter